MQNLSALAKGTVGAVCAVRAMARVLAVSLIHIASASAQCQPQWLPGDGIPGVDGTIFASIMWDPDGAGPSPARLVVGGDFPQAGTTPAPNLAMWDGTAWQAIGGGTNGEVDALAVGASGELIVAGKFLNAGGVTTSSRIASWDGLTWTNYGEGLNNTIYALLVLPGGDIVAGGAFSGYCSRWNGTTWTLVRNLSIPSFNSTVFALALMPNGDIVAGGEFAMVENTNAYGLARWNGTNWIGFGHSTMGATRSLALEPGGTLLAAGSNYVLAPVTRSAIARWNGTAWSSFPINSGWSIGLSIAMLPGGQFVLAGVDSLNRSRVTHWNGSAWIEIGASLSGHPNPDQNFPLQTTIAYTATAFPDGRVFTGGSFRDMNGKGAVGGAIWDGANWSSLGTGTNSDVVAFATLANGDVVVGGRFRSIGGIDANHIAIWNGASFTALGAGTDGDVLAVAVLPNGDIVAGGDFTQAGGVSASRIARWNGSQWVAMGSGMEGVQSNRQPTVRALAAYPDGRVAAGGLFTSAGGTPALNIATWNGSAWSACGPGTSWPGSIGIVFALQLLANGDLVAAGYFTAVEPMSVFRTARWNGSTWFRMGDGMSNQVNALTLLTNGSVLAAGPFNSEGNPDGIDRSYQGLARWTGTLWAPVWASNSPSTRNIFAMGALPSGGVVMGGSFAAIGPASANNIVRSLNLTTWSQLGAGTSGRFPTVRATCWFKDREILAGGSFARAGGLASARLARWSDLPKPWIAVNPLAQNHASGDTLVLTATPASGYSGVSYQWQRNGVAIVDGPGGASVGGGTVAGASGVSASPTNGTPALLTISGIQPSDAGAFSVVFTNTCGSATSDAVTVSVESACPGDLNSDSLVDDADFVIFSAAYDMFLCDDPAMPAGCPADMNADELVDDADFVLFASAYNELVCP